LNSANKIAHGDAQVSDRLKTLRNKISGVEMRSDLKSVMADALKKLESVQNGMEQTNSYSDHM